MSLKVEPGVNKQQAGFTLLQVLLVLGIITIVVTMSVVGIAGARSRMRLASAEQELRGNLERARTNSIKRRAQPGSESSVKVIDSKTYRLKMDFNGDGVLGASEFRNITLPEGVTFQTSPMPAEVLFDQRGYLADQVNIVTQNSTGTLTVSVTGAGGITSLSGMVSGTPVPTPSPTPSPTPTPTPAPPSGPGGCVLNTDNTSPKPLKVRKNGLTTGTVTVLHNVYGSPGTVTVTSDDPELTATPTSATISPTGSATITVKYMDNGWGFTKKLTFNSLCGAREVDVEIIN